MSSIFVFRYKMQQPTRAKVWSVTGQQHACDAMCLAKQFQKAVVKANKRSVTKISKNPFCPHRFFTQHLDMKKPILPVGYRCQTATH